MKFGEGPYSYQQKLFEFPFSAESRFGLCGSYSLVIARCAFTISWCCWMHLHVLLWSKWYRSRRGPRRRLCEEVKNMLALRPVDQLNFSNFNQQRLCSWEKSQLRSGHIANTNMVFNAIKRMGKAKKEITIFFISLVVSGLLPVTIFGTDFYFKRNQEFQIYDTYYIFRPYEFALVTTGLTLFFVFFIRAIQTRFKNKLSLTFLTLGTIVLGLVIMHLYQMFNSWGKYSVANNNMFARWPVDQLNFSIFI